MIRNQKGQALIEMAFSTFLLFILIEGIMILFILISHSLWIHHSLYQSLVCLAEGRSSLSCEKKLRANIKRWTSLGRIKKINLQRKNQRHWSGTLHWNFYKFQWNFKQEFMLPRYSHDS